MLGSHAREVKATPADARARADGYTLPLTEAYRNVRRVARLTGPDHRPPRVEDAPSDREAAPRKPPRPRLRSSSLG